MTELAAIRAVITADDAQFQAAMKRSESSLGDLTGSLNISAASIAKMGAAAVAAGAALVTALVKGGLDTVDAQYKLARQVGGTTSAIQTLEAAAKLAGVSSQTLTSAMGQLNVRLGEAQTKGGNAADALKRLGLDAKELASLDVDERMASLADAMQGLPAERIAFELRELGIRAKEVAVFMRDGGDAIRNTSANLERLGVLMSDVDAAQIEAANDAMEQLGFVVQGVKNQFAKAFAPVLKAISDELFGMALETGNTEDKYQDFVTSVVRGGAYLLNAFQASKIAVMTLASAFTGLGAVTASILGSVAAAVTEVLNLVGADINYQDTFFAKIEQAAVQAAETMAQKLDAEIAKPWATDNVDAWLESVRTASRQAAEAAVAARQAATGEGGEGAEAEQKAEERANDLTALQDYLNAELFKIQQSLKTKEELLIQEFEMRRSLLLAARSQELIDEEQFQMSMQQLEANHQQQLDKIREDAVKKDKERKAEKSKYDQQMLRNDFFATLSGFAQNNKKMFNLLKVAAIGEALIKAKQSIVNAYEWGTKIGGPPFGAVAATVAAAATAAQVAQIRAQGQGGGGGAAAGATMPMNMAQPQAAAQPAQSQIITVRGVDPGMIYSGDAVRMLAERLLEYQKDGGKVVFA